MPVPLFEKQSQCGPWACWLLLKLWLHARHNTHHKQTRLKGYTQGRASGFSCILAKRMFQELTTNALRLRNPHWPLVIQYLTWYILTVVGLLCLVPVAHPPSWRSFGGVGNNGNIFWPILQKCRIRFHSLAFVFVL